MPPSPQQTAAPVLERTFEVSAGGRCHLRVPRAAVTLEGGGGHEAEVFLTAAAPGPDPDAAQTLADTLRVRYAGNVLRVEPAPSPRLSASDWRALREGAPVLALRVRLPAAFGADVHAPGGQIEARDLGGSVTLEATGGTIRSTNLTGRLDVHAYRCQTTVEAFDGEKCSVHLYGGSLTLRAATARTVAIASRAARLRLDDLDAALHLTMQGGSSRLTALRGALHAEVFGGRCHFTPEPGHPARLRAPGGDVHLALPPDLTADLRLSAHRLSLGALPADLDGERDDRRAEGPLNGGGPLIEARAPGGALRCE